MYSFSSPATTQRAGGPGIIEIFSSTILRMTDGTSNGAPRKVARLKAGDHIVVIGAGPAGLTAAYILTKEEGGRHKPFFNNYRPQFFFRTTDVTGTIELPSGTEMVMPGDNVTITVELGKPIAMDEGLRFAIREGGRTVGAGRVTKIVK